MIAKKTKKRDANFSKGRKSAKKRVQDYIRKLLNVAAKYFLPRFLFTHYISETHLNLKSLRMVQNEFTVLLSGRKKYF